MTVQTTASRADYTGNGSTTVFSVPFYFIDQTHILVLRTQISTGVVTTLALTTNYTVSGVGVSTGGSITCLVAPTADQKISILRNIPLTQLTHYVENDPFPAASHETALDKLTMEVQQVNEVAARALQLSPNTSGVSSTLPTPIANRVIGWDASGTSLQNVDPTVIATQVTYGATNAETFSGTGAQTSFTLSTAPGSVNNLDVSISGVTQRPTLDYTWSGGTTLTFTSAPPSGTNNILVRYNLALSVGTVNDGSITPAKLSTGGPTWNTSGNVGIGNASPTAKLDINVGTSAATAVSVAGTVSGNAVYQLMYNASATAGAGSGFILWNDNGFSGNSANILFYSSASTTPNELRINQGATAPTTFYTAGTERMRIDGSGNATFGTTSYSATSGAGIKLNPNYYASSKPALAIVTAGTDVTTSSITVYSTGTTSYRFYVSDSGVVSAVSTTISAISDRRFKENIVDLDVGLNAVMALKPRKFDWKQGKGKDIKGDRGFIAQEFEQVFPDLIDDWKDPAPEGEEPYKSVRQDLIPVLVKAVQEQQQLIDNLTARIAALEA